MVLQFKTEITLIVNSLLVKSSFKTTQSKYVCITVTQMYVFRLKHFKTKIKYLQSFEQKTNLNLITLSKITTHAEFFRFMEIKNCYLTLSLKFSDPIRMGL